MRVTGKVPLPGEPWRAPAQTPFQEALERCGAPAPSPAALSGPPSTRLPELREAARATPPSIGSSRNATGAMVEVTFGAGLSVELHQVAGGLEVALRARPSLEHAARRELPGLLALLRERGLTVVRAGVRGGSRAGPGRSGP